VAQQQVTAGFKSHRNKYET